MISLAAATVAGAFTALSLADTARKHDRFVADGCAATGAPAGARPADCVARSSEGEAAQTRTNVLLGATAILVATTALLGVFTVPLGGGASARASVGPAGASVALETP
jgi:hypothetical protein